MRVKILWINKYTLPLLIRSIAVLAVKIGNLRYSVFKAYCQLLKMLLERLRRIFIRTKFDGLGSQCEKMWRTINKITGKGRKPQVYEGLSEY